LRVARYPGDHRVPEVHLTLKGFNTDLQTLSQLIYSTVSG